jgi:hypothetical protein
MHAWVSDASRIFVACRYSTLYTEIQLSFKTKIGNEVNPCICKFIIDWLDLFLQGITIHYLNYGSTIKVTLAVDDAEFPDCQQLLDDFVESIRIIKNAATLKTST